MSHVSAVRVCDVDNVGQFEGVMDPGVLYELMLSQGILNDLSSSDPVARQAAIDALVDAITSAGAP